VSQVLLYAAVTGGALVIGAALGCFRTPPKQLTAGMLAFAAEQSSGMLAGFAAGAVLASLADSVMPEAHAEGGPLVAFATSAGFLVAFALTTID
jgi:zinc transporter ZupT